ncbi:phosphotransferase family protein [Streptomyces nigra]|uniref:phosphotransferase family protein n=1 Tax=Streptomyces nigra TaxID=1827580 RepID=UPI0037FC0D36
MTLTRTLRGVLPLRPAGLLTRPADTRRALALADSLGADGARAARRTFSDLLVFELDGDPPALVKHPRSARATDSLTDECATVRNLAADERLGDWRRLLPALRLCRLDGPRPSLVVESRLPGVPADTLLRRSPWLARPVALSALEEIRRLHRATGHAGQATDRFADWVDSRVAVLADEIPWCGRGRGADALGALRDRLAHDLAGRRLLVGWTHGDFHPGNVLTDRRGTVCGLIDWAGAVPDGPCLLDCHTFVLTLRHQRERRQFGHVVADVVRAGALPPGDRTLLAEAGALGPDPRGQVALTLLTWLWHVAGNARKSARYGRSRRWVADNVVPVLAEVAARATP